MKKSSGHFPADTTLSFAARGTALDGVILRFIDKHNITFPTRNDYTQQLFCSRLSGTTSIYGVPAQRSKDGYLELFSEAKSGGKLAQNLVFAVSPGIDIGYTKNYVAVPVDRADEAVRSLECFTTDLHQMARWLKSYSHSLISGYASHSCYLGTLLIKQ